MVHALITGCRRLCGFPPFYDEDIKQLFEQIKKGAFDFPSPYWDEVSDNAKTLIKKLLQVDPKKRLKASDVLSDPWVTAESTPRTNLPNVLPGIKAINAKKKFKKAGDAALAAVRFSSLLDLKKK
jgi:serine/threonine protein kinase